MGLVRDPGPGHQALMAELHGVCDRFETNGIPPIEQIAIVAQLIGQKISGLDPKVYDSGPVLQSVIQNIVVGNDQAAGGSPAIIGRA